MRRSLLLLAAFVCGLFVVDASAAGKIKIKWLASVYIDAAGSGLKHPEGVSCGDDSFVVADSENSRILRYAYRDGTATPEAEFRLPRTYPLKVQVDAAGDIYYLDGRDRRVASVSAEGEDRGALKPRSLPFSSEIVPKSFALGRDGNLYLLDVFSANVIVLDPEGQYVRSIAFPERYGFMSDVTVDRQDSVFVVDGVEAAVYVARVGDERLSLFSDSAKDYVNFPANLSVDDAGVVYLVDQAGGGLALLGPDGAFLGRKLGMGWNESSLYYPAQICISSSGTLFVADRNNSRIQIFALGERSDSAAAPAAD